VPSTKPSSSRAFAEGTPATGEDPARDGSSLLEALVTVADLLLTDLETHVVMQRMATVLTQVIPDVVSASVAIETPDRNGHDPYRLVAASDPVAERIDEVQYGARSGPGIEALADGRELIVERLPVPSWPEFSEIAAECGVDWTLSLPMRNGEHFGVLNVYAVGTDTYDEQRHLNPARVFARYAATILAAHTRYLNATAEVGQLHQAIASRATIEQAKGMLMLREGCSADEAFKILVHTSQRMHLKLRDVAAEFIATVLDVTDKPAS
jgi:hypothetical protein